MDNFLALLNRVALFVATLWQHALNHRRKVITTTLLFAFIVTTLYALFIQPPANFPAKYTFTVSGGASVSGVATSLQEEGLLKSPFVFKVLAVLMQSNSGIFAGDYYFDKGESVFNLVKRTTSGDFNLMPTSVFIPEGSNIFEIAKIFEDKFTKFQGEKFIELAVKKNAEGYLFPDTYQFLPNVSERKVFDTMRDNFDLKIAGIQEEIDAFDTSLEDIIIMASLIEKESANDFEERRIISGILWNRISIGMALQVDAVFPYINGKNTYELSIEDLNVESPYNTYQNPGLPVGPITNPGLDSIKATINPEPTNYLFYLHDDEGGVHYSADFEGHKENKFRYLR